MFKKNIKNKNNGFTLIETLVALSIFSFSILALVATSTSSLTSLNYARNRVVANYLSQEGIESVRNVRDSAVVLNPETGWTDFKSAMQSGGCASVGGCNIDSLVNSQDPGTDTGISPCVGDQACVLYADSSTGYLGTSAVDDPTNFRRVIQLIEESSDTGISEFRITSTVYWMDGGNEKTLALIEYIYDWQ